MGNKLARNRLKAQDFHYIAKNTAFLTNDVSTLQTSHHVTMSQYHVSGCARLL